MTNQTSSALKITLLLLSMLAFAACGQKGPLQVEQPPAQIQVEEPEETK